MIQNTLLLTLLLRARYEFCDAYPGCTCHSLGARALFFFARNPVVDSFVKRKDKTTVSEAIECYEGFLLNHSSPRTCHVSPFTVRQSISGPAHEVR